VACATRPKQSQSDATGEQATSAEVVSEAAAPASEPERSSRTWNLESAQRVVLHNPFGDVRLRFNGYGKELEFSSVAQRPLGSAAFVLDQSQGKEGFELSVRLDNDAAPMPKQRMDVVLYVPEGHAVEVHTQAGNVEARGLKGDLSIASQSGNVAVRGLAGALRASSESGSIEVSFEDGHGRAPQRLSTSTGAIIASFGPQADFGLAMATSGLFATEYSLAIQTQAGQEPNKHATATLGAGTQSLSIESKRGEIRLYRRASYQPAG
jgi:hypothetical protein